MPVGAAAVVLSVMKLIEEKLVYYRIRGSASRWFDGLYRKHVFHLREWALLRNVNDPVTKVWIIISDHMLRAQALSTKLFFVHLNFVPFKHRCCADGYDKTRITRRLGPRTSTM